MFDVEGIVVEHIMTLSELSTSSAWIFYFFCSMLIILSDSLSDKIINIEQTKEKIHAEDVDN